ncbi:MAG: SLBB domain-containing protein [Chloracidobacterium sp.]|nr:SLBB domain-containing protein [Chloracidobacterium sp.]
MKFKSLILFTILAFSGFVYAQDGASQENTVTRGYTLGPGDQVAGTVHGELGYDFVGTIDEDGMLAVPFMKKLVAAQCRTEREIKAEIETEVKKYLRDPSFNFRVTEKHSRSPVSISGEIMKPSEIILTRKATLLEILSVAGGPKEEASGEIQVSRPKTPLCMAENDLDNWKAISSDTTDVPSRTYSYAKVLLGKEDSNPTIYPGDRILVKRAAPVYVNGEVVGSQAVFLKENGLSLAGALGMVGGSRPGANIKNIAIYRLKPGAGPESQNRDLISANLKLIREGKQTDVMLQPYDVVVVDKAKDSIGKILLDVATNAGKTLVGGFANATPYRVIY